MRLFLILICLSTFAFAYKVQGILKNTTTHTISIQTSFDNNLIITILPQTHIEVYSCGIFGSNKKQANVQDLKKGSLVKIKGSKNGNIIIAEKIIVECDDKRRAF
ncbi:hypothetical protein J7D62_001142 [Campylobacter lari]|uniref:DUF5666 domain-containing protein n=1 Tax=Campylobacter lari (strain RM2100 / D67 / ATCC BAA-1060) TaxID=306263 RepID=B9KE18_CAMLR|nr:hypothetical protein [Campylobacter lari]ACM64806.2 hypothetical protein CLA_1502 [Campylobacter lari RM2100]EAH5177666.1 hypothetical protein [Campylobacter lari]EAI3913031.1 hypothetical protein [Campylobacter lari]EAJ0337081.1 hypothetical protein [Campylobacter lari]EAJ5686984.1 hypothetical protein [Campylobacter lari]